MNATSLGQRFKAIREARAMSQAAVAQVLDIPRTAISRMESGQRAVSTRELAHLADLYRYPVASFFAEPESGPDQDWLLTLHRMEPELQEHPEIRGQLEQHVRLCQEGTVLRDLLNQSREVGLPLYAQGIPQSKGEAIRQGDMIAEEERSRLGLGRAPVSNIAALLSTQGVWISWIALPDHWSGLCLRSPSTGLAILINADHPFSRQRFALAHEWAHALLDRKDALRVSRLDNAASLVETRAHAFAATFLMPPDGVDHFLRRLGQGLSKRRVYTVSKEAQDHGGEAAYRALADAQALTYQDVSLVARHFGVSYRAALYRLQNLHYLSNSEVAALRPLEVQGSHGLAELGEDGMDQDMHALGARNLQNEIVHLAMEAYRLAKISQGRLLDLSRLLPIKGPDLVALAEAACVSR